MAVEMSSDGAGGTEGIETGKATQAGGIDTTVVELDGAGGVGVFDVLCMVTMRCSDVDGVVRTGCNDGLYTRRRGEDSGNVVGVPCLAEGIHGVIWRCSFRKSGKHGAEERTK